MSENAEFAKRIIKMRVIYVLEKSQGQILDEKNCGILPIELNKEKVIR